ncbi:hypothetical protein SAMN02799624_05273 [Paenibacillus sp. UNC496MF]|uniref:hypothetical protein n=1 Tax=Paenibacillus sp. UNC496MF TaxID=1502753 RepID=UPI0008EEC53E|nr:hypothetical protein [Paenibacillus sp. UNC496MF]SFJ63306.1 hypothetical protein SAMN02799624_05273 [Paenibacillus sp. UNC496MF]
MSEETVIKELNFDLIAAGIRNMSVIPDSEYEHMHKAMPVFNVLLNETETDVEFLKGTTIEQFEITFDYINNAITYEDGLEEHELQFAQEMRNALFQYCAVRDWIRDASALQTFPRKVTFI